MQYQRPIKIYTAGKMAGLTYQEMMEWRRNLEQLIVDQADVPVTFIHPPMYFNYDCVSYKTQEEIKEWELNHIRECDVVVVNLNGVNTSVGTHFELGFVNACNTLGNKHIYVIGIGETDGVHPWVLESVYRQEENVYTAARYILDYFVNI